MPPMRAIVSTSADEDTQGATSRRLRDVPASGLRPDGDYVWLTDFWRVPKIDFSDPKWHEKVNETDLTWDEFWELAETGAVRAYYTALFCLPLSAVAAFVAKRQVPLSWFCSQLLLQICCSDASLTFIVPACTCDVTAVASWHTVRFTWRDS